MNVQQALEFVAGLMGVEASSVDAMLTQREVKTVAEVFTKQLELQDAERTRDAVVKALYAVC